MEENSNALGHALKALSLEGERLTGIAVGTGEIVPRNGTTAWYYRTQARLGVA